MAVYQLKNNLLTVQVKSFGAELSSVVSNETGIEYIWQADENVWARHAPNLFPIVGKLKGGEYFHNEKSFKLSQHGFARDCEFTCIEQKEHHLLLELSSSEKTLLDYPFHFTFQIEYQLNKNNLEIFYSVFNRDSNELYFSVGAHPAFNCPLQASETFNDYSLLFPNKNNLMVHGLNDGLTTNTTRTIELENNALKISKELFDKDALVFMNHQIDEVQLISNKTKHGVRLSSPNWPYFGIWTKKNTEQFVCLEPWYGIADKEDATGNMVEKDGIIKLKSNEEFDCSYIVSFY